MFSVTTQCLPGVKVLRCRGKIVIGEDYSVLFNTINSSGFRGTLILDLAEVDRIDAAGLGVLLSVRSCTLTEGIRLKIMNAGRDIQRVLQLTNLESVFELCCVPDIVSLLCLANAYAEADLTPATPICIHALESCTKILTRSDQYA